jgi:hypothetical protein
VIDTSVFRQSVDRVALVKLAQDGVFTAVWSDWIVGETWRLLTWQRVGEALERTPARRLDTALWRDISRSANSMMRICAPVFELIRYIDGIDIGAWPGLEENDQPIFATAIAGRATFVVSVNTRDFPPLDAAGKPTWAGVTYVTPPTFMAYLASLPAVP